MNTIKEQVKEQQREAWNQVSTGWKKWDALTMEFIRPMGEEMIRQLRLQGQEEVLDIASGTGEPGLTIAGKVPKGKVIATDISEDMLDIAKENADKRGIGNFQVQVTDACSLPFPDQSFDCISCRFGFMFFPDMELAAKEMARVLKPGGRIALSIWGPPEKNFWVMAMMGPLMKSLQMAPPPPDAPGIFRCAEPGTMEAILSKAGFKKLVEKEVSSFMKCESAEMYWEMMTEIAAPVRTALAQAEPALRDKLRDEVIQDLKAKNPEGNIIIKSSAWVVSGER